MRVVGMEAFFFSLFYFRAAQKENTDFFRLSIITRPLVLVVFAIFAALGYAPVNFVLLGILDPFFALWTWFTLRSTNAASSPVAAH